MTLQCYLETYCSIAVTHPEIPAEIRETRIEQIGCRVLYK